ARRARPWALRRDDGAPGTPRAAHRRAADPEPPAPARRTEVAPADDDELRRRLPARARAVPYARVRGVPRPHAGPREPRGRRRGDAADRPVAGDAAAGAHLRSRPPRLSGVAVQRSQAPRHGDGQRGPARAARRGAERISHPATLGRRRLRAVPPRRPRPELRLCDRRPRRRGCRRPGGIRRAPLQRQGPAPRLLDVAPAFTAGRRPLILGAPEHVEIEHADAHLPADGMAERADQQRRAAASVRIGRPADVPPEPAVRLVAEQLGEDLSRTRGAELDAADAVGTLPTIPRRADGEVLDAVSIEITGGDDHPCVELARLASRPVP